MEHRARRRRTYYWHSETGASQYEKPADFDPGKAQNSGSYTQYQNGGGGGGGGGGYGGGGYGGGGGIGLQFSRPANSNYKDVQDQGVDQPASTEVAQFWKENDLKVYGGSPPPFLSFEEAQLPRPIMDAIAKAGFSKRASEFGRLCSPPHTPHSTQ